MLCVVKWLPLFATVAGNPQTYAYGQLFNQTRSWIGNSLTNREVWGIEVEAPGVPFHLWSLNVTTHACLCIAANLSE